MIKYIKSVFLFLFTCCFIYNSYGSEIGVIVNRDLIRVGRVRDVINRYIWDLEMEGINVWVDSVTFDNDQTVYRRRVLRDSLRVHWRDKGLEGAVLVGELPVAMYEEWVKKDKVYEGDNGPVDYYFMDLDEELDTAWHDDSIMEPFYAGYYDGYSRENIEAEIWVSRVIGHNFYYRFDDASTKMKEDSVICAYFDRVHKYMNGEMKVHRRGLLVGDFRTYFDKDMCCMDILRMPYEVIDYPYDKTDIWERELKKSYEYVMVMEHSSDNSHVFARDHEENNGRYISSYLEGLGKKDRAFTNIFKEGDSVGVLFFHDLGCSNLDYSKDNCLGAMYGILGGLICFGATVDPKVGYQCGYLEEIGDKGHSFGEAYKSLIVSRGSNELGSFLYSLIGVGNLKLRKGESKDTLIVIDSVSVKRYKKDDGYYLHGDTLSLKAYTRTNYGNLIGEKYKWYGYTDSIEGNERLFVLDGYNITPVLLLGGNDTLPIDYNIMLHVERDGYLPASKIVRLPGWILNYIGSEVENVHRANYNDDNSKRFKLIGVTKDLDDYIYFYRKTIDRYSCYEVGCKIEGINNVQNGKSMAGILIANTMDFNRNLVSLSLRKDSKVSLIFCGKRRGIEEELKRNYGYYINRRI